MNIQWYPGHMAKTRRQIVENLKRVDAVCEIVDARIPQVSRNPDLSEIAGGKPRLIILNRVDLADPRATDRWAAYYRKQGYAVLLTDARKGSGVDKFSSAVQGLLAEKLEQWKAKGQTGRNVKIMIVGIPNVGKSTFINKVIGKKSAKASDKPGVTRGQQWFRVAGGLELLDTPGMLWPKLDDQRTGIYLAVTGAVKDDILDVETLACHLMEILYRYAPNALAERYKMELPDPEEMDFLGYELLQRAGRKRGFLISGGEIDTERMARILLDEYRGGKLGRITLETPEEYAQNEG